MTPRQAAVLLSGGLDSCVLAAEMRSRFESVLPLYVKQGLRWESTELHWVRQFLFALRNSTILPLCEVELPIGDVYQSHWSTTGAQIPDHRSDDQEVYLPGRNLLLLAKTSILCALRGISVIALGPLGGNPFPDSTPEFFSRFQDAVRVALRFEIVIETPFSQLSKKEVVQRGRNLPLELTFSCINPAGLLHCGACNKCAERRRSFQDAGIADRTQYKQLPILE